MSLSPQPQFLVQEPGVKWSSALEEVLVFKGGMLLLGERVMACELSLTRPSGALQDTDWGALGGETWAQVPPQ